MHKMLTAATQALKLASDRISLPGWCACDMGNSSGRTWGHHTWQSLSRQTNVAWLVQNLFLCNLVFTERSDFFRVLYCWWVTNIDSNPSSFCLRTLHHILVSRHHAYSNLLSWSCEISAGTPWRKRCWQRCREVPIIGDKLSRLGTTNTFCSRGFDWHCISHQPNIKIWWLS